MSPLVYPFTRNSISSGASSSPPRLRWIKSTVRIMSNLAYHPKGLKVKVGLCHPEAKHPFSGVTTPDSGQLPLELKIVHPAWGLVGRSVLRPARRTKLAFESVLGGRLFRMIDHDRVQRKFLRVQLEPDLLDRPELRT